MKACRRALLISTRVPKPPGMIELRIEAPRDCEHAVRRGEVDDLQLFAHVDAEAKPGLFREGGHGCSRKENSKAFSGRRIVTLCTYPSEACGAANVLDVVHRHSCTLEHPDEGWQILTRIPA